MSSLLILVVAVAIAGYLFPFIVAAARGHMNTGAILILNLFLGWTFLGWVLALVWACTANTEYNQPSALTHLSQLERLKLIPSEPPPAVSAPLPTPSIAGVALLIAAIVLGTTLGFAALAYLA